VPVGLVEFRVLMGDYSLRHLRADVALGDDGDRATFSGTVCDVTAQHELAQQVDALTVVAEAIGADDEPAPVELLARLGEALGVSSGAVWAPDGDGLVLRDAWRPGGTGERPRRTRLCAGQDAPGLALAWRSPVSTLELAGSPTAARSSRAAAEAYHGFLAFPALRGGAVIAVVCFESQQRVRLTPRLESTLTSIGRELGALLARHEERARSVLSSRELEILQLAADGVSGPGIAAALHVSISTVKTHFDHIYRKCDVADRSGAVAKALREGLIR
jgi:DNA-binding CsgD family transcriptional regulator